MYIVYKILNKNEILYIGCHKTENLNDKYFGSGAYLEYVRKKYKRFLKREIICCLLDKETAFYFERYFIMKYKKQNQCILNYQNGGFPYKEKTHPSKAEKRQIINKIDNYIKNSFN